MKKYLIISFVAIALFTNNLFAGNPTAYLTYAAFNIPNKGPFFETYLSVLGNTVKFVKNANGKYQGAVDITVSFKQNGEIKKAQKYTLSSPEVTDTSKGFPNFIDQQRYPLANGTYSMELTIADKNGFQSKAFTTIVPIVINFKDDVIAISDIQLLESYTKSVTSSVVTKSGYDLIPYISTYFPENINNIKVYAEIYNAKKIMGEGQRILVSYYLESFEKKVKLNEYSAFIKQNANDVNIVLAELNVAALPSGNYNFVIEVRDKDNKIQAEQKCFIQRKNKQGALSVEDLKAIDVSHTFVSEYKSVDTLLDYIRCLRPISSYSEIQFAENQLKEKKIELMQQFFYNFWKSRNASEPQLTWLEYYKDVMVVNKEFGTYGLKGYDTDRGRVYLQYGPPIQRDVVEHEPNAYPYEIWQYDQLVDNSKILSNPTNKQSNKKFVFYNPDLVSNKYKLLHSTAQGEVYEARWQVILHGGKGGSGNFDDESVPDDFGGHSDDNFNHPK